MLNRTAVKHASGMKCEAVRCRGRLCHHYRARLRKRMRAAVKGIARPRRENGK
jgi:hypothetical protein